MSKKVIGQSMYIPNYDETWKKRLAMKMVAA